MTHPIPTLVPEDALVHAVAAEAAAAGMYLICNGRRRAISPVVPRGWVKLSVQIDPQQATPCTITAR